MHLDQFPTVSFKPKSTPYTYAAQQHWHPLDFPHTMVEHRSGHPSELVKFLTFLRGKSKNILNKVSNRFWGLRASASKSLPYKRYRTVLLAPEQTHPDYRHLEACSSGRSEHFSLLSVAENWAPLIFSCSHNQSNPFNPSNLHQKKKKVIYEPKQKKNIYKVCTIYTSDFLWDTLHQKKEGHGSETSLHIKCWNY